MLESSGQRYWPCSPSLSPLKLSYRLLVATQARPEPTSRRAPRRRRKECGVSLDTSLNRVGRRVRLRDPSPRLNGSPCSSRFRRRPPATPPARTSRTTERPKG